MANEKVKAKAGMEGRTSRTSRWAPREWVKKAAKKARREEDRLVDSGRPDVPTRPPHPSASELKQRTNALKSPEAFFQYILPGVPFPDDSRRAES